MEKKDGSGGNDSTIAALSIVITIAIILIAIPYLTHSEGSQDEFPLMATLTYNDGKLVLSSTESCTPDDGDLLVRVGTEEPLPLNFTTYADGLSFIDSNNNGLIDTGDYFVNSGLEKQITLMSEWEDELLPIAEGYL